MSIWRAAHVGLEGDGLTIDGVEIWKQTWHSAGEAPLSLPHPSHPNQRHRFEIYQVGDAQRPIRFAAGELSNGVWGFYVGG